MLNCRPRRWLAHIALAFGAGVLLGFRAPWHPLWLAGPALCLLWGLLLRRGGRSVYLACMAGAALLGLARCSAAVHPVLPEEGSYAITATVQGEATRREADGRLSVWLKDVRLAGEGPAYRAYWTYWPQEEDERVPLDGQQVRFTGSVYHPMGQSNPHGFDFRLYLLQKDVTLGVSGCKELSLSPEEQTRPADPLIRLRASLRELLDSLLGDSAPLAAALILGDKSDLPEDVARQFRLAGVAHVLAVSGLHVMILFGFILFLLRRFSPSQKAVLAVSLVLLGFYALLTGMTASILRAALMLIYIQTGRILRRHADRLTGLASAFLLILLFRPVELSSAGFQMSFGAVLGMILLGDQANRLVSRIDPPRLRQILKAYLLTLCASAGAALPVIWYYHRLSLTGLLISPLAVALVGVLLPLLLVTLLLSLIWPPLAFLPAQAAALGCRALIRAVAACAGLPFATLTLPRPPVFLMAAILLALVLCTRFVLLRVRLRLILGLGGLLCSALLMLLTANRDVRYIQLSAGSADAAVIEDGGQTIVIDAAENGGDLAGYLLSEGRRIDTLILTHLHSDHVLGLADLMAEGVPIGEICLSTEAWETPVSGACRQVMEEAISAGISLHPVKAGDSIATERVRIDVLWPSEGAANPLGDGNDFALALAIDLDGVKMLHMSDVNGAYELYAAAPAQVLRVAHHGSASSTGADFLRRVQPDIALISTRKANGNTLARLAEAGVMVYDTNACGALTLTARRGEASLRRFIQE